MRDLAGVLPRAGLRLISHPFGHLPEPGHPDQPEHEHADVLHFLPVDGVPRLHLPLLFPKERWWSLGWIETKLQEQKPGCRVSVPFGVAVRVAVEINHVTTHQTGETKPGIRLWVHCEGRRPVLM